MSNRKVRNELTSIYGKECMLSGLSSELSLHHIIKREHNGKTTIENGAILNRKAHDLVHTEEHRNKELYRLLNECLELYKQCIDRGKVELIEQYDNEVKPIVKRLIRGKI